MMYYGGHTYGDVSHEDCQKYKVIKRQVLNGNINIEGKLVDTPPQIRLKLKLHQQRIVYEMLARERSLHRFTSYVNMAVLSDKVGSGKSLSMLSLIAHSPQVTHMINNNVPYKHSITCNQNQYIIDGLDFVGFDLHPTREFKSNLIVVPHNIFNQWKGYLKTHTTLRYKAYGSIYDFKDFNLDNLDDYHVVLVKSTKYDYLMSKIYEKYPVTMDLRKLYNEKVSHFRQLIYNLNRTNDILYEGLNQKFLKDIKHVFDLANDVSIGTIRRTMEIMKERTNFRRLIEYVFGITLNNLEYIIKYSSRETTYKDVLQLVNTYKSKILNNKQQILEHLNKITEVETQLQSDLLNLTTNDTNFKHDIMQAIKPILKCNIPNIQFNLTENIFRTNIYFKTIERNARRFKARFILDDLNKFVTDISYPLYHKNIYSGPVFQRVILDEVHTIKLSNTQYKKQYAIGKFIWFITSSVETLLHPNGYYNNIKWNTGMSKYNFARNIMLSNVHPTRHEFIKEMFLKNSDACVDASFKLPDPIIHKLKCKTPPELKILNGIVLPKVIRALNAGDMSSAIRFAGCTERTEEDITKRFIGKYNDKIDKLNERKNKYEDKLKNDKMSPSERKRTEEYSEKVTIEMKQLTKKIEALRERITNLSIKDCPICISKVQLPPALVPCCNNVFCFQCITNALSIRPKCPLCRTNISVSNLTICQKKSAACVSLASELPSKVDATIGLIKNKPDGKFLVFSEFNNTFHALTKAFVENDITYKQLKGSGNQINNTMKKFDNGQVKVLLLNASFYGSGMNLQMTTDIIISHRMSRDMELQIIGRGQRLGRTVPLNVHYLCYETEKNN